eukprot:12408313-Karenia_brevis.AAC.1
MMMMMTAVIIFIIEGVNSRAGIFLVLRMMILLMMRMPFLVTSSSWSMFTLDPGGPEKLEY